MSGPDLAHLAELHALADQAIPNIVLERASGADVELVWRNDLGGLTFRMASRGAGPPKRGSGSGQNRWESPPTSTNR